MKPKIYWFIPVLLLFCVLNAKSQQESTFEPNGNIYGDLFLNTNYNISKEYASFRLNRLHFGYKYNITENLYFNGMIESALEDYQPVAIGGDYNGITNLFEFCLGINYEKLEGKFGLIGTEFNQQQEKLWQHRYVDKVYADKYGYAPTNDFGVLAIYKLNDMFKTDLSVTNGEGHKSLQADSSFRYAIGATVNLSDMFVIRVYSDFMKISDNTQMNLIGMLGYTSDLLTAGIEWNQQNNSLGMDGYQRSGLSGYAAGNLNGDYQVFARYDMVSSNKPTGFTNNWNAFNDGNLIIAGVQRKITDGAIIALDFRNWSPDDSNEDNQSYLFFEVVLNF